MNHGLYSSIKKIKFRKQTKKKLKITANAHIYRSVRLTSAKQANLPLYTQTSYINVSSCRFWCWRGRPGRCGGGCRHWDGLGPYGEVCGGRDTGDEAGVAPPNGILPVHRIQRHPALHQQEDSATCAVWVFLVRLLKNVIRDIKLQVVMILLRKNLGSLVIKRNIEDEIIIEIHRNGCLKVLVFSKISKKKDMTFESSLQLFRIFSVFCITWISGGILS